MLLWRARRRQRTPIRVFKTPVKVLSDYFRPDDLRRHVRFPKSFSYLFRAYFNVSGPFFSGREGRGTEKINREISHGRQSPRFETEMIKFQCYDRKRDCAKPPCGLPSFSDANAMAWRVVLRINEEREENVLSKLKSVGQIVILKRSARRVFRTRRWKTLKKCLCDAGMKPRLNPVSDKGAGVVPRKATFLANPITRPVVSVRFVVGYKPKSPLSLDTTNEPLATKKKI